MRISDWINIRWSFGSSFFRGAKQERWVVLSATLSPSSVKIRPLPVYWHFLVFFSLLSNIFLSCDFITQKLLLCITVNIKCVNSMLCFASCDNSMCCCFITAVFLFFSFVLLIVQKKLDLLTNLSLFLQCVKNERASSSIMWVWDFVLPCQHILILKSCL